MVDSLGRISTPWCRYTSSATYFGLALSRDIRSRDLKLVNANIPTVILEDEEGSSESEDLGLVRRTGRDRRPTQRYLERDTSADEETS